MTLRPLIFFNMLVITRRIFTILTRDRRRACVTAIIFHSVSAWTNEVCFTPSREEKRENKKCSGWPVTDGFPGERRQRTHSFGSRPKIFYDSRWVHISAMAFASGLNFAWKNDDGESAFHLQSTNRNDSVLLIGLIPVSCLLHRVVKMSVKFLLKLTIDLDQHISTQLIDNRFEQNQCLKNV